MKLLAVDLGLTCGWACGDVTAKPGAGVWPLPRRDKRDTLAARIATLRDTFTACLENWNPALVIAAEAVRSRNSGEAAHKGALMGVVREQCWRQHVEFHAAPEGTVRKALLGRGTGPTELMKQLALAWCQDNGILVPSHDAADAVVLWSWCRQQLLVQPLGFPHKENPVQPELCASNA